MLTPHRDFPVRPRMMTGESLAGYFKRFYFSNGYPLPQESKDALRDIYAGNAADKALRLLQGVVGESNTIDWWTGHLLDARSSTTTAPKWRRLEYDKPRFCPACLEATDSHLSIWELPIFYACPFHGCALLDTCNSCGRSLTWASMALGWHCQCGALIKAMPTVIAPTWTVDLSRLMTGAVDVRIPDIYVKRKLATHSRSPAYSLGEILDTLAWAYDLRKILTRRKWFRAGMWPPRLKPSTRAEPGAWEARLLADSRPALNSLLTRLFKWNLRDCRPNFLIWSNNDSLQLVLQMLALMPASEHLFAATLHQHTDRFLDEYRALPGRCTNVYFHPAFSPAERSLHLTTFAHWWHVLSNRINLLESGAVVLANSIRLGNGEVASTNSTAQIVATLNELIDCAAVDIKPERLWKLASRWHVPVHLRRHMKSEEVLTAIAEYFAEITSGERAFFMVLLAEKTKIEAV